MLVQIEITTVCNYGCFYCAGRAMPARHMPMRTFDALLSRLPPGPSVVSLQGEGEPFLHPGIWKMAARVREAGKSPYTITNGTTGAIAQIADLFPTIGLSIDTIDPAEAERIGRYNLPKVLRRFELLLKAMGPDRINIHTVDYGQDTGPLKRYLAAVGAKRHVVQPLQSKPDYSRRYAELAPPPTGTYRFDCRYLVAPSMVFVNIDGKVMPCPYIKDASKFVSISCLMEDAAARRVPECCIGCREILTGGLPN